MKERWVRYENGGWQFYGDYVSGSTRVYVVNVKEELLKALDEFEGDTVLVPVAMADSKSPAPRVCVDKAQVVAMIKKLGVQRILQVRGKTAMLESIVGPTDFNFN